MFGAQTCVLVANGPSLNKIRWDWQDNFNVIMGMNKIFLGLERYNITKVRAPLLTRSLPPSSRSALACSPCSF